MFWLDSDIVLHAKRPKSKHRLWLGALHMRYFAPYTRKPLKAWYWLRAMIHAVLLAKAATLSKRKSSQQYQSNQALSSNHYRPPPTRYANHGVCWLTGWTVVNHYIGCTTTNHHHHHQQPPPPPSMLIESIKKPRAILLNLLSNQRWGPACHSTIIEHLQRLIDNIIFAMFKAVCCSNITMIIDPSVLAW